MGVVVRIGACKALLREGEWRCANPRLEQRLNTQTQAWILETGGPALGAEDPEAEVAREMARRHGGVVQMHAPAVFRAPAAQARFPERRLNGAEIVSG